MTDIERKKRAEIFDNYTSRIYLENPDVIDSFIFPPGEWSQEELDLIMRGYILKLNMESTMNQVRAESDPEKIAKAMWRLEKLKQRYLQLAGAFEAGETVVG